MNKQALNLLKRILKSKGLNLSLLTAIFFFIASTYTGFSFNELPKFFKPKEEFYAVVTKVSDGDTLHLRDINNKTYKVRLQGIDAPELRQEFGKEAKEYLSSLIKDKEVKAIIEDKDKYNRYVATIYLNKMDINRALVSNGYAHAYKEYSTKYIQDENNAKSKKIGLWKNDKIILPSEFRKMNKGR